MKVLSLLSNAFYIAGMMLFVFILFSIPKCSNGQVIPTDDILGFKMWNLNS